ncbi:hypothetical protein BDN71DRAFT_762931 [Pleurotus eryngii]|uniref:Integral membrane protein n=1 Tax=Pleurotus eryngii TaxID=5323 RepID=A0A9P5ZYF4_PLEER|nr:hypothetical protein BDN71DRAFT_762931 [Pleurotus eryngii]
MDSLPSTTNVLARWHHHLHPSVHKHSSGNALPKSVRSFIHPTHAVFHNPDLGKMNWTSRSHRKNRYTANTPASNKSRHARRFWHGIGHMLSRLEYWNVSWWIAILFTVGSIVWVVNGFFVFLPFANPALGEFPNAAGWTAFAGASIFETGALFGVWEAWNRDDAANFGWSIERTLTTGLRRSSPSSDESLNSNPKLPKRQWKWFTTDSKYWHELGFLAAFVQFWAATIFWISGYTSIPTIQNKIQDNTGLLDGVFFTPQVVGGSGFIIASVLWMLETQKRWYAPSLASLGWQAAFWNFVGAIGFTLCGALGYAAEVDSGAEYQSNLATFWGGWAFLIGSVFQWYESVNSVATDGKSYSEKS